jgi:adenosine deaminase
MDGVEKAELHCHLDGLIDPAMLDELPLGLGRDALQAIYPIDSMARWQEVYLPLVAPCMTPQAERFGGILERHVRRLAAQRVVYAEIFVSGLLGETEDHGALVEIFRGLARRAAHPEIQVELVCCVGRGAPARLERQVSKILALHAAGAIRGVALAGDESAVSVRPLAPSFDRLRATGMGIEIHAGEHLGPESVRDAIEHGRPDRIGHGIGAFRDPALIDLIRERGIHLEMCPTSNLRLGAAARIEEHPIGRALELGLEISINTDDPGPFGCSISSEYALVDATFGLDPTAVLRSVRKAAFSGR